MSLQIFLRRAGLIAIVCFSSVACSSSDSVPKESDSVPTTNTQVREKTTTTLPPYGMPFSYSHKMTVEGIPVRFTVTGQLTNPIVDFTGETPPYAHVTATCSPCKVESTNMDANYSVYIHGGTELVISPDGIHTMTTSFEWRGGDVSPNTTVTQMAKSVVATPTGSTTEEQAQKIVNTIRSGKRPLVGISWGLESDCFTFGARIPGPYSSCDVIS